MPDIHYTRRALARLDQIGAWIARDDPDAATRVLNRIVTSIERLRSHPQLGRPGRITNTRELVLSDISYIVAYRVAPDEVQILTVMHMAQKWPEKLWGQQENLFR